MVDHLPFNQPGEAEAHRPDLSAASLRTTVKNAGGTCTHGSDIFNWHDKGYTVTQWHFFFNTRSHAVDLTQETVTG